MCVCVCVTRLCPSIGNSYRPKGFDCFKQWKPNPLPAQHRQESANKLISSSCAAPIHFTPHIFIKPQGILSVRFFLLFFFIFFIVHGFTKIPRDLAEKWWEGIIGTRALKHNLHIYLRNNTSQARQSGAPDPFFSLAALWSHSGWSPGWADSPWKAALFNERCRAWVQRQQVGCWINALQLRMDHFPCQLSSRIMVIKKINK